MKKYWYLLFVVTFSFLFVPFFFSLSYASIVINEIYPAPSTGEYEWVELYNTEDKSADISQYQLFDLDGHKIKISTNSAPPFSFVVSTSSAVLNNTGDTVILKNNSGEILDIATYSGSFESAKTIAKCPDAGMDWFVLNIITKGTSNEPACLPLTPTIAPSPVPTITQTPTPTNTPTSPPTASPTIDYDSIFISEVYPYPNNDESEWIELYNSDENEVVLTNWKVDDIENGGSSPHSFTLTIPAKQYGIVSFSSSLFNNSGDNVRLLNSSGTEKDSMEYTKAKQGLSFGRESLDSDIYCLQSPSPNATNNICSEETQIQKQILPTLTKTDSPSLAKLPIIKKQSLTLTKNTNNARVLETAPQVLGEMTSVKKKALTPTILPYLSTLSASYALLTLVSIFVKMKYANNS